MTQTGDSRAMVAGGQSLRMAGVSRDVALHDQLFRYAEDLQQLIERQKLLEEHHERLLENCARLTESRDMLDALVSRSDDLHLMVDSSGRILQGNPAASLLAAPGELAGTMLRDWVMPLHQPRCDALFAAASAGKGGQEAEIHFRQQGRPDTPLILSAQVLAIAAGTEWTQYWVLRDVTRLNEAQFETQVASMAFKSSAEALMITDVEGVILAVNPAFTRITGYADDEVVGHKPSILSSGVQTQEFYQALWHSLKATGAWQGEIYNRRKSGEIYPEWLTISAARDAEGQVLSYISVFSDLSQFVQAERRMAHLAYHDSLTGLPNRLLFQDRIGQALVYARRDAQSFSVIYVDLDGFKKINDTHGHEAGDAVLRAVAERLSGLVREEDTVARLGGDEFAIIAPGRRAAADGESGAEARFESVSESLCRRIIDIVREPIAFSGKELYVGCSLGSATYPDDGEDDASLLRHADMAMYRVKKRGGNAWSGSATGESGGDGELSIDGELRQALAREQLRLEYQPIVALADGRVTGVEALLRWDHPAMGTTTPSLFGTRADRLGVMVPMGRWVLRTACEQLARWDAQGHAGLTLAVNVSWRQVRDPAFIDDVCDALASNGIRPNRLELDVTEAEPLYGGQAEGRKLSTLRDIGVRIAVDDFGRGPCSLEKLPDLGVDRLKFASGVVACRPGTTEIRLPGYSVALLAMANALPFDVLAKGVETREQHRLLLENGCPAAQGFHYAKPLRPAELCRLLQEQATGTRKGKAA